MAVKQTCTTTLRDTFIQQAKVEISSGEKQKPLWSQRQKEQSLAKIVFFSP